MKFLEVLNVRFKIVEPTLIVYLMITIIRLAELFWYSIVVCLRQEPFYGGTLFGLKHKKRENIIKTFNNI